MNVAAVRRHHAASVRAIGWRRRDTVQAVDIEGPSVVKDVR